MDQNEWMSTNLFEQNRESVLLDEKFQESLHAIKNARSFWESFTFLQIGRNVSFIRPARLINSGKLLNSIEQTLLSVELCCEYGSFSDASILLRKYRDDIFFHIYVVLICRNQDALSDDKPNKHKDNLHKWLDNDLSNLPFSEVLSYIGGHPSTKEIVEKYKLKNSFDTIGKALNDYVHGNGISYYNHWVSYYTETQKNTVVESFIKHLNLITVTYVFLLTLVSPLSIMSSDYIDYLDFDMTPPDGSQYWVAPFIKEFMNNNKQLLDDDSLLFLRETTNMEIV